LAIIKSKNIGSFYHFVNRKLSCRTGVGPLKSETGGIITDDTTKASALNEYFCNVFTVDDGNTPRFERRVGDDISMNNVTFSSYLVFSISFAKKLKYLSPALFLMLGRLHMSHWFIKRVCLHLSRTTGQFP